MAMHRVRREVIRPRSDRVSLSHVVFHRGAIGLVRKLRAKSHDHVFRVVTKHGLTGTDLGWHELREGIEVLVLCLLSRTRVDAGC